METVEVKKRKLNQEERIEVMIDRIIANFNFEKCSYVMKKLDWQWYGRGVPTVEMLIEMAKSHMRCAAQGCLKKEDHKSHLYPYSCFSGGLKATAWRTKYWQIEHLELEFVLTEWNCDGDDI